MFKKKSALAMLLAGLMIVSLASCGNNDKPTGGSTSPAPSQSQPADKDGDTPVAPATDGEKIGQTVLKCSFNQTLENPEAKTMLKLSDDLYDATEGRYSIEVYPSEQLGNQQESLELVQSGAIDMAIVANSIVEGVNSDFAVIGCPYIYDDIDHQQRLFESGKLDDLFATTEASGFTVLSAYSLGARCVYGKKPVTSPEDLAGMKIRVMQSDTMIQMMNILGAEGTAMAQGDVYSAIQSGMLDGAENNIITYTDLLQYEVAPHYSITNHLMIPDELIINTDLLGKMSAEDQAALKKVAGESVTYMFDLAAELRETYFEKCKNELNVTVTEVDVAPFQEKMADFISEIANRSDMTKNVYQAIQDVR